MPKNQKPENPQPLGHREAGRRIEAAISEAVEEGLVRWEEGEDKVYRIEKGTADGAKS
ncbi:MAG: hypothetical protein Q7S16_00935 [bacterium]|nr:hypothetical protein [bacterium]